MEQIDDARVRETLSSVRGWERVDHSLRKTFSFETFPDAIAFVDLVALIAQRANHHPDMDIRWTRVTVTTSTHDAGGLTQRDLDLVAEIERAVASSATPENGAPASSQDPEGGSGSVPGTLRGPSTSPMPVQEQR